MYKVLICDDNPLHAAQTRDLAGQILQQKGAQAQFVLAYHQQECLELIARQPEAAWIVFMDIIFPDQENGIRLAQRLQAIAPTAQLIFLTVEISFCTKVGQANPIFFLTKPIDREDFALALQKAMDNLERAFLPFFTREGTHMVATVDIFYIERNLRVSIIHTRTGTLTVSERLEEILQRLNSPHFLSPHKSFVVNLRQVTSINARCFTLSTGEEIPISHAKSAQIKQQYLAYVGAQL